MKKELKELDGEGLAIHVPEYSRSSADAAGPALVASRSRAPCCVPDAIWI
jgi:hypothetical protein